MFDKLAFPLFCLTRVTVPFSHGSLVFFLLFVHLYKSYYCPLCPLSDSTPDGFAFLDTSLAKCMLTKYLYSTHITHSCFQLLYSIHFF